MDGMTTHQVEAAPTVAEEEATDPATTSTAGKAEDTAKDQSDEGKPDAPVETAKADVEDAPGKGAKADEDDPAEPAPAAPAQPESAHEYRQAARATAPTATKTAGQQLKPGSLGGKMKKLQGGSPAVGQTKVVSGKDIVRRSAEKYQFPLAIGIGDGGELTAKTGVIQLDLEEFLGEVKVTGHDEGTSHVTAQELQTLRDMHRSSAFNLIFGSGGKANIKGVDVAGGRSVGVSGSKESRNMEKSRKVYLSAIHRIVKASFVVPQKYMSVSEAYLELLKNVLSQHGNENEADRRRLRKEGLIEFFQEHGFLAPLHYELGGRLAMIDERVTNESLSMLAEKLDVSYGLQVGASLPVKGMEAKIGGGAGRSAEKTTTEEATSSFRLKRVEPLGGDNELGADPARWRATVNAADRLMIIGYDRVVPIWTLFPEALKTEVQALLSVADLRKTYKAKVEAGARQAALRSRLEEEDEKFRSWKYVGKTVEAGIKAKDISPDPTLASARWENDQVKRGHSALFGIGVKSDERHYTADEGFVISYVSASTRFHPPGHFQVDAGGLGERELKLLFYSAPGKGMEWKITVHQARAAQWAPDPMLGANVALYKALLVTRDTALPATPDGKPAPAEASAKS